ncbi:DUF6398 domain-containing protein [Zobellella taiwanensis]|uniref:DUF6398 domain-containing protein n=1 Tax=Zobellella taiwanensis TaxID=347535 RepID=UPI0011B29C95|nr:DUF6398 domain-containing protein [Zobellella taiwanensis]
MEKTKHKVPEAMKPVFESISEKAGAFSEKHLNPEYTFLIHKAISALCRKRPSPLLKGKHEVWAAGVIHALGMVNFLFDKTQKPHCKPSDIWGYFGVGESTVQGKSKQIRETLKMGHWSVEWMLTSRIDDSPMVWMVSVNGLIVDVRDLPVELQEEAVKAGLIPYMPKSKQV